MNQRTCFVCKFAELWNFINHRNQISGDVLNDVMCYKEGGGGLTRMACECQTSWIFDERLKRNVNMTSQLNNPDYDLLVHNWFTDTLKMFIAT